MSLKQRITRLEQMSRSNGEDIIWVKIVEDDETVSNCSHRRDDCPEYPCRTNSCWMEKKYPDMKVVNVGVDNDVN